MPELENKPFGFLATEEKPVQEKKHPHHKNLGQNLSGWMETSFMPAEIIGGSIPYIAGMEDEAVWNAAAQGCGTERVHYVYTIDEEEKKCWYIAAPSSSLASHPDSWCPLAAALPGNSEFWDKDTVYIYEQDGTAAALRWDQETGRMQVFSGASRTIMPRIQAMDANFVTVNVEKATPVAWRVRRLNQEYLSRQTIKAFFWSGMAITFIALLFWIVTFSISSMMKPDLAKAKSETRRATENLMISASQAMQSASGKHLTRIQELLDQLGAVGGTLLKYDINSDGKVTWEALIPPALSGNNMTQFRATTVGRDDDGRLRIRGTQ